MKDTLSTGIEELDSLLRGGIQFPNTDSNESLIVLIRGKAGTGKSTLALQIVTALAMQQLRDLCDPSKNGNSNITKETFQDQVAEVKKQHLFFTIEQNKTELAGVWQRLMRGFIRRRIRILKRSGKDVVTSRLPKIGYAIDWKSHFKEAYRLHLLLAQLYGIKDEDLAELDSLWCDGDNQNQKWESTESPGEPKERCNKTEIVKREEKQLRSLLANKANRWTPVEFRDTGHESRESPYRNWPSIEGISELLQSLSSDVKGKESAESGKEAEPKPKQVVVCDGMSVLTPNERSLMDFRNLLLCLRRTCKLAILIYEPVGKQDEYLDHLCDLVIELAGRQIGAGREENYYIHEVIFRKARYQDTAYGWHLYKFRPWGLEIFPSIHFQVHQPNILEDQFLDSFPREKLGMPNKKIPSKKHELSTTDKAVASPAETREFAGSFLELMLGGIMPGSTTVVLGPRGSFKTSLSQDFLFTGGCALEQSGLLISMIDDERTLRSESGLSCPNMRTHKTSLKCANETCCKSDFSKNVFLFYQRPGCVQPSEFLQMLRRRLAFSSSNRPVQRVAFWDLTQIDHRFPMLSEEPMFLPAMVTLFKDYRHGTDKRVSSVIIGASNARNAAAASVMADNVIFLRRATCKTENERNKPGEKVLLAYVDRVQGHLGSEGKALYCLPLDSSTAETPGLAQDCIKTIKHYRNGLCKIYSPAEHSYFKVTTGRAIVYKKLSVELSRFQREYILSPSLYETYKLECDEFDVPKWIDSIIKLQEIGSD